MEPTIFITPSNADNGTPTWTNVEGNLSVASVRSASIMVESGITYYIVGTSIGLYCTTTLNGSSTVWSQIGSGSIRYAVARSLALRSADNFLLVGTHGNGMYMVEPPRDPVISFVNLSSSTTETTTASLSCRNYTDITVEMQILSAPTGAATVTITNTGTASEGTDFDILNVGKQLTFPDGVTGNQSVDIRIYDDTGVESDETIILDFTVSGTTDATKASFNETHTLTINDNDVPPSSVNSIYSEDFESGAAAGFSVLGFGGATFAQNFALGINGGMSGTYSIYNSSDGANPIYDNATADDIILRTPLIDATGLSGMELSFDFRCNGENGADYGRLYYSFDGFSYFLIEGNSTTGPYVGVTTNTTRTITLPGALDNTTFYLGWRWTNDANSTGSNPGFVLDNIEVYVPGGTIESTLNATDGEYFGPFETVYFYDGADIILSLTNNSNYDYGCTTVDIDRAGTGATQAWSAATADYLTDKTYLITPTNNSPGLGDSYDITVYYTAAEISGWITGSDPVYVASDGKIVKSTGAINSLNPGNQTAIVNGSTTYNAFGSDHSYSGTFTGGFSGFAIGNPINLPLPVGLLSLQGEVVDQQTELSWMTAWELNSDYFEVERSADGQQFSEIGLVKSMGNSDVEQAYQFTDLNPINGINYYRLKQVDIDGRVEYSNIIRVRLEGDSKILVSPNPFRDYINISFEMQEKRAVEFTLFSIKGEQIISRKMDVDGTMEEKIDLPDLPEGVYLYQIRTGKGVEFGKMMKR
jgi:hypothetical protein